MMGKASLGLAGILLTGVLSGCGENKDIISENNTAFSKEFFVCNAWEDLNRDGKISYPEEYINIGDSFNGNEPLAFVARALEDRNLRAELEYKTIGLVYELDKIFVDDSRSAQAFVLRDEIFLSPGDYTVRFYDNNNQVGSKDFRADEFLNLYVCRRMGPDNTSPELEQIEIRDIFDIEDTIEIRADLSRKKDCEFKFLVYDSLYQEIFEHKDEIKALNHYGSNVTLSDSMKKRGTYTMRAYINEELVAEKKFTIGD